jgi:hypothetical protein
MAKVNQHPQSAPTWMDGALIGFFFLSMCHLRLTLFFAFFQSTLISIFFATLFSPCPFPKKITLDFKKNWNFIFSPHPPNFLLFVFFFKFFLDFKKKL